ncbi:MAG: ATP-binding cassette domain-containing protein [Chitinophagaceae bacterium]
MSSAPVIQAQNIKILQDSKTILDNVHFSLEKGQNLILTGVSGVGKTILAKAIAKKLYVLGTLDVNYDKEDTDLLSETLLVEQRYSLKNRGNLTSGFYYQQRFNSSDVDDCYTVREELQQISTDSAQIDFLLSELEMEDRKDAPVVQLSSGEHKRFQIIKALLRPTQIMLLDEPFIGLDKDSRKKLYRIIDEKAAQGTTFVIISGVHHPFPKAITHVLELSKDGNHQFAKKEDFVPCDYNHSFNIDIDKIHWQPSEMQFQYAIRMVHTFVRYGNKTILDDINWDVLKGEKWLLQGHNGAGKSTLLSLITGDNPQAYANEIYLFDKRRGRGESIWDVKRPIGFVSPEIFAYYDKNLTVHDAIASGLFDTMGLFRKLTIEQEAKVQEWIAVFHLEEVCNNKLSALSSGQQRMVLLANALVKNPPLLLLDEPCQGLDEVQTKAFVQMVDELCGKIDTTVLYISHYENEVPKCIDHVLKLDHGKSRHYGLYDSCDLYEHSNVH